jgi:hypothetical protein
MSSLRVFALFALIVIAVANIASVNASVNVSIKSSAVSWSNEALRLTGESNFVRSIAIKNLQRIPNLTETLLRELNGSQKALALDAITALKITSLVPNLLELAVNDNTGQVYLTIDALITPENITQVLKAYESRLLCRWWCQPLSAAAKIVVLEALGRTETVLSTAQLRRLFNENSYEVRSAILRYTRRFLLSGGHPEFLEIAHLALRAQTVQVRKQAEVLLTELKTGLRP